MSEKENYQTKVIHIPSGDNQIYGTLYLPHGLDKYPLIIMSHGYNGIGDDFCVEADFLARHGIAVYALDFCGGSIRSRSSGKTEEMTIFTEKRDLLSVFDYFRNAEYIDTSRIYLFGGSMGGFVTTLVAEQLGEQIAGVALYFPALCIPDNWRDNYPDIAQIPPVNTFWDMPLGRDFFVTIHDMDVFETIGKYAGPVLIMHGSEDGIVPLSYSQKAASLYPNARLIVYEKEGHGFTKETVLKACESLLEFLS